MNAAAIVVDASVAVKWLITEQFTDLARSLLASSFRSGRPLVCPPHFLGEVTNAIYRRYRSADPVKHISLTDANIAMRELLGYPLELVDPPDLYPQAFEFAVAHGLPSIYDSLYVVLAHLLGAELWTADQRLLTALGPAAPWVRAIADYPLA